MPILRAKVKVTTPEKYIHVHMYVYMYAGMRHKKLDQQWSKSKKLDQPNSNGQHHMAI